MRGTLCVKSSLSPAVARRIAEHAVGLRDGEQRLEFTELAGELRIREMRGHQLAARRLHQGVGGGDGEDISAEPIRLYPEAAGLRDVAGIDPPPEIPAPQCRIVPV